MEIKLSTIRISQESVTLLVLLVHEQRANNEKIGEFIDLMINAIAIFFFFIVHLHDSWPSVQIGGHFIFTSILDQLCGCIVES